MLFARFAYPAVSFLPPSQAMNVLKETHKSLLSFLERNTAVFVVTRIAKKDTVSLQPSIIAYHTQLGQRAGQPQQE